MNFQPHLFDEQRYAIVADIGGTNARFCCVDLHTFTFNRMAIYACANFPSLQEALLFYQKTQQLEEIKHVAIAIACPITDDFIRMTNFHWEFSLAEMKERLALAHLQVINDFAAIAMSLPVLKDSEKIQIGRGLVNLEKAMVVLGAGTGLGVAHLIPNENNFIALAGEGGHVSFAAQNEQEWFIQRFLTEQYGHVSCERLLSGPGLENIYLALAAYHHKKIPAATAAEISHLALSGQCDLAAASVRQFFATLGSLAGDLALSLGAFGGVYIAGGIVPKLITFAKESEFRARFEAKGRSSLFNQQIASFVVVTEQPGLIGAAQYLKQNMAREHYVH
ncbi:glucokinase [Legionella jordanis]|uniref:Glucokinase n=1 Tax=Legionella jordanis TaxID=456 RepID=A0A0W0VAB3_9GAMM|nr:glucokinase [Legionella jordanis]KTD17073.1 glucokinase [Legionella jordanis]RMX03206.1 glucokinase [Legionella jordanis]RMX18654.1 glucokinase [Legionella jordanis]VEH12730.1 glucokinase [Legionella jordanis]HAT8713121.1 glucokinase [Legionella jordanis]